MFIIKYTYLQQFCNVYLWVFRTWKSHSSDKWARRWKRISALSRITTFSVICHSTSREHFYSLKKGQLFHGTHAVVLNIVSFTCFVCNRIYMSIIVTFVEFWYFSLISLRTCAVRWNSYVKRWRPSGHSPRSWGAIRAVVSRVACTQIRFSAWVDDTFFQVFYSRRYLVAHHSNII